MLITFNQNVNGEPVFASCPHKDSKNVMTYLIKIIKELDLDRPEMLIKKVDGDWKLKFIGLSKKDVIALESEMKKKSYKFNGELIEFNFGGQDG